MVYNAEVRTLLSDSIMSYTLLKTFKEAADNFQ